MLVSGVIHVGDWVRIVTERGGYEVIIFPLQTAIDWNTIVQRSIAAFRSYDGKFVTLSGELHGGILASARLLLHL